jgi:hypothetical protein
MQGLTPRQAHTDPFENERQAHTDVFENDWTASADVRTRQLVLAWRLDYLWWAVQTKRGERGSVAA